jgi:hypothetical protein
MQNSVIVTAIVLLLLACPVFCATPYLTSLLSGSEVNSASLITTGAAISGYNYTNTTVTLLQVYSAVPSIAYGIV